MSKPKFGYWDIRGLGQPIRFLLAHLGLDYEERVYPGANKAEWWDEKLKLDLDFPNIPYWIDEKVKLTEKLAIIKYLCRKHDRSLMPEEPELWKSEMIEGVCCQLWDALGGVAYSGGPFQHQYFDFVCPSKLVQLEKFIGKFSLGEELMYVDFLLYEVLYQYQRYNKDILQPFSKLQAFMKNFENLPRIGAYIAKNPEVISRQCFNSEAKIIF